MVRSLFMVLVVVIRSLLKKSGKLSKSLKLFKLRNSKGKNLAELKKPSKSGNLYNFDAKKFGPSFLTPKARAVFNRLRLAFTKTLILWHFYLECHIWIETDALHHAISGVLSQLASEICPDGVVTNADLGQWYPIAFFFRKIISAETWYKTQNSEFFAIIKAFKMWRHYLKGCKYEVLVFTDHNNFRHFINTKSLSSKQVCWA